MSDDKPVNHIWSYIFVAATILLFTSAWWSFSARLATTEIIVDELVKQRDKEHENQKTIINQQEKILEKIEN